MKRFLIITAVLAAVAGVIALLMAIDSCPEECTYVTREFKPAHENNWVEMHCMSHDAQGNCDMSIPITHTEHIPDKWFITYRDKYNGLHTDQVNREQYEEKATKVQHQHLRWSCN